jgi:hypothetical protein
VTDADLQRALDDARADLVAAERTRQRWLRQQAEQSAALAGTLLALLESGVPVTCATTSGATHQGRLTGMSGTVCALRAETGQRTWIRLDALTTVRAEHGHRLPTAGDDRTVPEEGGIAEILAGLADDRPRVALRFAGTGRPVAGELRAVGTDVATLYEGERRTTCYVRLASVTEVSLLESG